MEALTLTEQAAEVQLHQAKVIQAVKGMRREKQAAVVVKVAQDQTHPVVMAEPEAQAQLGLTELFMQAAAAEALLEMEALAEVPLAAMERQGRIVMEQAELYLQVQVAEEPHRHLVQLLLEETAAQVSLSSVI